MKVLLIGGKGFIGKNLILHLKERKINYLTFDKNKLNLKETSKIINCVKKYKIDIIINLAGISQLYDDEKINLFYKKYNYEYVEKIIEELNKNKFKGKFINMSSAYVYEPNKNKINEFTTTFPQNYYAMCKNLTDIVILYYSKFIDCYTIRLFNVIGCHQAERYLIPTILKKIKKNKILKLNDLKSKRDFIDVRDVSRFIIKLIKSKKKIYPIINLGSGKVYNAKQIASIIAKKLNKKIKIKTNSSKKIIGSNYYQKSKILPAIKFKIKYNIGDTIDWIIS
jgi:nucleoside-diphosphate-sugar epimerase